MRTFQVETIHALRFSVGPATVESGRTKQLSPALQRWVGMSTEQVPEGRHHLGHIFKQQNL